MKERIKELRKTLKLSQTEFGSKFGVGLGVIKNFEYGLTVPNDVQLKLICDTFNVRREWLTDGTGEMFREPNQIDKVTKFISEALADESDSFRKKFIEATVNFTKEDWKAVEFLAKLATKLNLPPED